MRFPHFATRPGPVAAAAVLALAAAGCKTRTYNATAKSGREPNAAAPAMGDDNRPPGGKNGFQGIFLTTKPMIIWQCFDYAVKVTDQVLGASAVGSLLGRG